MGLDTSCVVDGQENHAAEFTCAICCNLVEGPLLTVCHHVFCTACLQDWLASKPSCPTCSLELDVRHGAGELRLASPLAWRVLGRLRVRCPVGGCGWVGEYSELRDHMTSSTTHQGVDASAGSKGSEGAAGRAAAEAEALKSAGNLKFDARNFTDALTLYTKAVNLMPEVPTYYLNRAASHFMLGRYQECIRDCVAALDRDRTIAKAHRRLARAHCELGEYSKAVTHLREASGMSAEAAEALRSDLDAATQLLEWHEQGEGAMKLGDYGLARTFFANILSKVSRPPPRYIHTVAREHATSRRHHTVRTRRSRAGERDINEALARARRPRPRPVRSAAAHDARDHQGRAERAGGVRTPRHCAYDVDGS